MTKNQKILFDEIGLVTGQPYKKGQWKEIAVHDDRNICGFFGNYRFLSNFWPAIVFLDGVQYSCSENAYQAAKFDPSGRDFFKTCTPYESIKYMREHLPTTEAWDSKKLAVMRQLLMYKFDKHINPNLYELLKATKGKYLEETNWWGDKYWGVHKTPDGQEDGKNNLGKLLMEIRRKT